MGIRIKTRKKRLKMICALIAFCMVFMTLSANTANAMVATDLNLNNHGGVSFHSDQSDQTHRIDAELARIPPLSQAVNIIRGNFELRKSALLNNDITFRPEEFEKILNVKKLRYITITKLPDAREGVLTLGGSDVLAGQTIARDNIQYMRLMPFPDRLGTINFYFKDAEKPDEYAILCSVSVLESLNFAPTANPVNITTQQNIPVFKAMKASDPDGDALNFRITEAPKKGFLEILHNGSFVYRPNANYRGNDKFVYRVQDEHGNWSNPATVSIRVTKSASSVKFTDMDDHWAANAAVKGVGAGFIDVNPDDTFNPTELMTRAEFVEIAMRAANLDENLPDNAQNVQTGFADDSDIPGRYKAHVRRAYELGIINGIQLDTGIYFDPNSIVTRAEAAVILNNILKIPALSVATSRPVFADAVFIPIWAANDIAALNTHGIINGDQNGNFNPYGLLDRAQSTQMLSNMLDYQDSVRKSRGWWANLFG
jgi:hypothetical protein